ncbi:GDSL-type esterase/lipase family protein [Geodermatophilus dictyosporus]|nr:GDSL-type esterase/lipase family protein [Geodermatophilus dictyosporus]
MASSAAAAAFFSPVAATADTVPGTLPESLSEAPQAFSTQAADSSPQGLQVIVNERGRISTSSDAAGLIGTTGSLTIDKPSGATVRRAVLLAASTGGRGPMQGEITLDGAPVALGHETASYIGSSNYWADVTSAVKAKLDTAPAGAVSFTLGESASGSLDGEILSVIFNDPNQGADRSVTFLFGATQTAGDNFTLQLSGPIDPLAPSTIAQMSLGISYGYQSDGIQQYSTVDVNGRRLTSSAGGEDDGQGSDGALITVGGHGDLPFNADAQLPPSGPRSDDELYDLKPFVRAGDTAINVTTANPSNDDNIFFAMFMTNPPVTDVITPGDPQLGPFKYVALGDSFSAGEGVEPFFEPNNKCHRSTQAYSTLVQVPGADATLQELSRNPDTGVAWGFQACSGAEARNLLNDGAGRYGDPLGQLELNRSADTGNANDLPVDADTDLVTVTIGGNDASFADIVTFCATTPNCQTARYQGKTLDQFQREARDRLAPQLSAIYARVHEQAPQARILVLGYPQLFPASAAEQNCAKLREQTVYVRASAAGRGAVVPVANIGFTNAEQNAMRRWTSELNQTIADRVNRDGSGYVEFVPVDAAFAGHEVCGNAGEWINGPTLATIASIRGRSPVANSQSFHPNAAGQADGYAAAVNERLGLPHF